MREAPSGADGRGQRGAATPGALTAGGRGGGQTERAAHTAFSVSVPVAWLVQRRLLRFALSYCSS